MSHWGSTNLYPPARQFASDPTKLAGWQIYYIVKNGIRYTAMGGFDQEMPDNDIWSVAVFLSRLTSLPAEVEKEWKNPPPAK